MHQHPLFAALYPRCQVPQHGLMIDPGPTAELDDVYHG
jgi:hypothetical protein